MSFFTPVLPSVIQIAKQFNLSFANWSRRTRNRQNSNTLFTHMESNTSGAIVERNCPVVTHHNTISSHANVSRKTESVLYGITFMNPRILFTRRFASVRSTISRNISLLRETEVAHTSNPTFTNSLVTLVELVQDEGRYAQSARGRYSLPRQLSPMQILSMLRVRNMWLMMTFSETDIVGDRTSGSLACCGG